MPPQPTSAPVSGLLSGHAFRVDGEVMVLRVTGFNRGQDVALALNAIGARGGPFVNPRHFTVVPLFFAF